MEMIKVYEAETLFQSVATRVEQYKELKGQLNQLKNEFTNLVNNDQFLGNGATAIKSFYQAQIDVVDECSSFIEQNVVFFEGIKGMAEGKELAGETVVKMPFLEEDLAQSNKRAYELVDQQKDDLQTIFNRISDLISLNVFSSEQFDTYMDEAESKRTQAIQMVNELDGDLLSEYAVTEEAQTYIFDLYSQLIEATRQGENISPLYFNEKAYKTSEIYQVKDEMDKQGEAYLTFKKKQKEEREIQKEIDAQANKPWYEKTWDTTKTFTGEITGYYDYKRATEGVDPVTGRKLSTAERIAAGAMAAAGFIPVIGWAGRALKGGKAIYSTAKGINAASHALDAYKTSQSLSFLEKSEKGIYGLVAANGMSEAVTGKDMFGNQLTEEQRKNSLLTALGIGGVAGAAYTFDRLASKNSVYNTNLFPPRQTTGQIGYSENKYEFNMVDNPGPLAKVRGNPATNFLAGKYNVNTLDEDVILYRSGKKGGLTIPGQEQNAFGKWFTREPAESIIKVRMDSAVKAQWIDPKTGVLTGTSPIESTYAVKIPKGTTIYEGPVGYQGGPYLGGENCNQIFISDPWKIEGIEIISETSIK